jgi:flagellar biogenesis protein FliO
MSAPPTGGTSQSSPPPVSSSSEVKSTATDRQRLISDGGFIASVLAFVGLLSYGVGRFSIDGFLGEFHLTFQDLGLQYTDIVASGALVMIPVLAIAVVVYLGVKRLVSYFPSDASRARVAALGITAYVLSVMLLVGAYLLIVSGNNDIQMPAPVNSVLLVILSAILSLLVFDALRFIDKAMTPKARRERSNFWRMMDFSAGPLSAVVIVGCVFWGAHERGQAYAVQLQAKQEVDVSLYGLHFLGIRARPVQIYEASTKGRLTRPSHRCLLYMGENGGTVVFYDPGIGEDPAEILRLPMEAIAVREIVGAQECHG